MIEVRPDSVVRPGLFVPELAAVLGVHRSRPARLAAGCSPRQSLCSPVAVLLYCTATVADLRHAPDAVVIRLASAGLAWHQSRNVWLGRPRHQDSVHGFEG